MLPFLFYFVVVIKATVGIEPTEQKVCLAYFVKSIV
nr:MAG TPA: hypothetical protein [Caudoviricetes sp.]